MIYTACDSLVEVQTDTILSLSLNLWLSDLRHALPVEGQRPPRSVHRRPDKYANLHGGSTIISTLNIIKTHPLPITMMVLTHTKLPITTTTSAKTAWTQGAGGYGGTLTKYLGKSQKPKARYKWPLLLLEFKSVRNCL